MFCGKIHIIEALGPFVEGIVKQSKISSSSAESQMFAGWLMVQTTIICRRHWYLSRLAWCDILWMPIEGGCRFHSIGRTYLVVGGIVAVKKKMELDNKLRVHSGGITASGAGEDAERGISK